MQTKITRGITRNEGAEDVLNYKNLFVGNLDAEEPGEIIAG